VSRDEDEPSEGGPAGSPPADQAIPSGRFGRLARLGLGSLGAGARLLVRRDADGAAAAAAEMLGTLRGLAAKAGQIASYVDGLVPEEHRALVDKTFGALRAAAPTSSWEQVRVRVEEELGGPVEQLFAELEPRAFASASIGQVHRGRLLDGTAVAVKVQHPGIDRAVLADLDNAGVIESLVGALGARKVGSQQAIAEVRQRFLEELDYGLEADRQEFFTQLFAGDPTIRIPKVYRERSARRVLTTALHHGAALDGATTAPEALRQGYAETMWRFVFCGNLVGGMFNADPHPGNYLFRPDGEITFLDFGCVQPLTPTHLHHARRLHRIAIDRDEGKFRDEARSLLGTRPGRYQDWAMQFSRDCFEPLFGSPFHLTRAYTSKLAESMQVMKKELMFRKDTNFSPLPAGMLFMNRLQFGFYSVLARLDVRVDYARIEEGLLARC
jgi:predicted unusual protein kinase regulating ubiquinone biosynthesis (AarF/ABC1/UbiB family)